MVITILVVFGLAIGSFINALVWRLHKKLNAKSKKLSEYSITKGRSMCVNCKHQLSALDLIPVFSWILLKGKCRYCHKKISWQYPVVEILTSVAFVFSYIFWPYNLSNFLDWVLLVIWLVIVTLLIALIIYDFKWQILPNKVVFPLYLVVLGMLLVRLLIDHSSVNLVQILFSIIIGGGLFYLLFQISSGKWIGGGDVKLGFALGAIVMRPDLSMLFLFLASIMGTLYVLPSLVRGRVSKKTRIPFGPFLIVSTLITFFFGPQLIDWYLNLIILS